MEDATTTQRHAWHANGPLGPSLQTNHEGHGADGDKSTIDALSNFHHNHANKSPLLAYTLLPYKQSTHQLVAHRRSDDPCLCMSFVV